MSDVFKYNGQLNLILGSMFSGKTSELVRRYNRHSIGNKYCLMIKYKHDTRYGTENVATHDKINIKAISCEHLYQVDNIITNGHYQVICIDEVQFYKDAHIFCDKWANQGLIVEACGLNGTFDRKPFPIISRLLPLAENISWFKAVCRETGDDAVYSNINVQVEKGITEVIGGTEMYNAVDRRTYFSKKPFLTDDLQNEFFRIYICDQYPEWNEDMINCHFDSIVREFNDQEYDTYDLVENADMIMRELIRRLSRDAQ